MIALTVLILAPLISLEPPTVAANPAAIEPATLISMGPDPGGHTGDGVTPTTTKTGQPASDSVRRQSEPDSGSKSAKPAGGQPQEQSGAKK